MIKRKIAILTFSILALTACANVNITIGKTTIGSDSSSSNEQSSSSSLIIDSSSSSSFTKQNAKLTLSKNGDSVSYPNQLEFSYHYEGDGDVSISSSDESVATFSIASPINSSENVVTITPKSVGNAVITINASETENYNSVSATYKVTVNYGYIKATTHPATDLVYNGSSQYLGNITTNVEGCTITYKVDSGSYSSELPKAVDAGTHVVYYKAEKANYSTAKGAFEVNIIKTYYIR